MTQGLTFFCLVLRTEVTTTRLSAVQSIVCHQCTDLDKVGYT